MLFLALAAVFINELPVRLVGGYLSYRGVDVSVHTAVTDIYAHSLAVFVNSERTKGRLHIQRTLTDDTAFLDLAVNIIDNAFDINIRTVLYLCKLFKTGLCGKLACLFAAHAVTNCGNERC